MLRQSWASVAIVLGLALGGGARAQFDGDAIQDAKAQDIKPADVVHWEAIEATIVSPTLVQVGARLLVDPGWSIYSDNLSFSGPSGFTVLSVTPPPTKRIVDPVSGKEVEVFDGGEFFVTLEGPVDTKRDTFQFAAKYVGCTKVICLFPYTEKMFAPMRAAAVAPKALASSAEPTIAAPSPPEPAAPVERDVDLESRLATMLKGGSLSFGMLLGLVFVGGLLSNLTPCVYPMIPITLRLLSRQGGSAYVNATAYAMGIVATYSVLGLVAALSGGMFGSLLASKTFNAVFAVLMILLGVTMLGFGDFSKLQMLGNRLGSGKPSLKNTFAMGTGAGLVAAPCTGPILAALLAYTANAGQGIAQSTLLLVVYSLGFGLPYILLGGAAAKVSAIKVGPQVQVGVKLLFASVMFGLGLYYLRIPLYSTFAELRPLWATVAPIALVSGVLLAAVWVIVPNLQNSKASMILPTVVLGVGIFALSQRLTTGAAIASPGDAHGPVTVYRTEAEAIAAATAAGRPILIDMWAEWCEACKKMDVTTFVDPEVQKALAAGWVMAKLDLTESNEPNDKIQAKYGLQSLPTLVLLPPNGAPDKRQNVTGYVGAGALLNALDAFKRKAE